MIVYEETEMTPLNLTIVCLMRFPGCDAGNVSGHILAILIIFFAKTLSKTRFLRQWEVEHVDDKEYDCPNANSQ